MAMCVKMIGSIYEANQILFYRCLFSTVITMAYCFISNKKFLSENWKEHGRRGLYASISMGIWYFVISHLPLAIATTLNYSSPLFIALFLSMKIGALSFRKNIIIYISMILGFLGVYLLSNIKSDNNLNHFYVLLGLFGAAMAAYAFIDIKRLSQLGENSNQMVFYFSLYATIFSGLSLPFNSVHSHSISGVILLVLIAVFATCGQFFVSRAYAFGHPLLSATYQYFGILFSALWGFMFWDESLSIKSLAGIILIVSSCLLVSLKILPKR